MPIAEFEAALKGVAHFLGGDLAATDASRILRVPGTVNYPDEKKRARGRVPVLAELVSQSMPIPSGTRIRVFATSTTGSP